MHAVNLQIQSGCPRIRRAAAQFNKSVQATAGERLGFNLSPQASRA